MNEHIPNEHLDPSSTYPLSGHPPTRLGGNLQAERAPDPYYQTFIDTGAHQRATSYRDALERVARGDAVMPAVYLRAATTFQPAAQSPRRLRTALLLLGGLASYQALTNNQAAALVEDPAVADPRSSIIADLFASRLIDLANPYLGAGPTGLRGGTVVYQLGDRAALRQFIADLTTAEQLAVTGGRDLPVNAVHLRHDVLAAELALRVAHHLRPGTVMGPHFSTFADLTSRHFSPRRPPGGPDLVLVRPDGMRIAIEVTASIGERFENKVTRWAQIIESEPLETSGLCVIFLVASSPTAPRRQHSNVRWTTYQAVARAVKARPGSSGNRVADRIGVATWCEWFPGPHEANDRFTCLRVDRRIGTDHWEPCNMWDPTQLPLPDESPAALRDIIRNSALLAQTPPQIRRSHDPARMSAALVRQRVGELRDVAPLLDRSGTRPIGRGQGATRDACLPARLIGPCSRPRRCCTSACPRAPTSASRSPSSEVYMTDMAYQRVALEEARRARAEHLLAVHEGLLTPLDVVDAAHEPTALALRKIRLDQVILAVEGTSTREWRRIRDLMLAVLGLQVPDRDLTIGWVIDPRAAGRRLHALHDAMRRSPDVPWHGFPWFGDRRGLVRLAGVEPER